MDRRRLAGAVGGGVIAGLGLTAMLLAGERKSGQPSELVRLERDAARRVDLRDGHGRDLPTVREQAVVQAGHLLLSGVAAAAYVAATDEETSPLPSGLLFGLAFYAAMHWIAGPALGVKRPEWEADGRTIGMHTVNHLLFGLATAAGARLATR